MMTKAVRIYGKNDLRLDDVQLPEIGPDDVRIRVVSDSLCMSSYKAAIEGGDHKRIPDRCDLTPTILGHEFCGDDGGPYAVDAPQEGQEEYGGHLEDQGPQEGDQGRGETVVESGEEAGCKNSVAHKGEGQDEDPEAGGGELHELRVIAYEQSRQRHCQELSQQDHGKTQDAGKDQTLLQETSCLLCHTPLPPS